MLRRAPIAALIGGLLALGGGLTAQADENGGAAGFAITGYTLADAGEVAGGAATVSDLGIDGALLTDDGGSIVTEPALRAALAEAHAAGRPASLLLANFDPERGDFSPLIGRRLLRDPGNRAAVAAQLAAEVSEGGWDGITVDVENLRRGDREGLTAFVAELRVTLPTGTALDIDIPATAHPRGWAWRPFDLPAIAAHVDHISLMAYDQHYSGGPAGPIAGFRWVRNSLDVALEQVTAAKLRLGVPGYAYLWREGRSSRVLSVAAARKLAGRRARWSKTAAEWHARLGHGRELWFSDARAMRKRIALARSHDLDGAAIWRLGLADRITPAVTGGTLFRSPGS